MLAEKTRTVDSTPGTRRGCLIPGVWSIDIKVSVPIGRYLLGMKKIRTLGSGTSRIRG